MLVARRRGKRGTVLWALVLLCQGLGVVSVSLRFPIRYVSNEAPPGVSTAISCSKSTGLCGDFQQGTSTTAASRIADSTCCTKYYQTYQQDLEATCDCIVVAASDLPCVAVVTVSQLTFGGGGNTFDDAKEAAMKDCQAGILQQEVGCGLHLSSCADKAKGIDVRQAAIHLVPRRATAIPYIMSFVTSIAVVVKMMYKSRTNLTSPTMNKFINLLAFILSLMNAAFSGQRLFSLTNFFGLETVGAARFDLMTFHFLGFSIILMHAYISFCLYTILVHQWPIRRVAKYFPYTATFMGIFNFCSTVLNTGLFYPIGSEDDMLSIFGVVIIWSVCWVCTLYFYLHSLLKLRAREFRRPAQSRGGMAAAVSLRLVLTCTCFLTILASVIFMESYLLVYGEPFKKAYPYLWRLFGFLWGLQGFLDAIVFGDLFEIFRPQRKALTGPPTSNDPHLTPGMTSILPCTPGVGEQCVLKIFVTTFNMGSARKQPKVQELEAWLKPDFDIYAIGVQECNCFDALARAVQNRLGGREQYTCWRTEMGKSVVLPQGSVGLLVCARTTHVKVGGIELLNSALTSLATGVDLGVVRMGNKACVGLALKVFNTSIGFVSAHFASDSSGKKRLTKRKEDSHRALKELFLVDHREDFDTHLQLHHVIFTGDLNFRCQSEPMEVLKLTARSYEFARLKKEVPKILVHDSEDILDETEYDHSSEEVEEEKEEKDSEQEEDMGKPWAWVDELDELRTCMSNKEVFSGFCEGQIRWAPSFRWKRGVVPRDFGKMEELEKCYTLTVKSKDGEEKRTPSYCDRILVHSHQHLVSQPEIRSYGLCSAITSSDHRPVTCGITLGVSRGPLRPTPENFSAFREELSHWKISLSSFSFSNASSELKEAIENNDLYMLTHFPLLCEDPVGEQRSLMILPSLSGRMDVDITVLPGGQIYPNTTRVKFSNRQEEDQPVCSFEALVYKEFTHAVLIKFVDGKHKDLGQGVLGISPNSPCLDDQISSSNFYGSSILNSSTASNGWNRFCTVQLSSGGVSVGSITLRFSVIESSQ